MFRNKEHSDVSTIFSRDFEWCIVVCMVVYGVDVSGVRW